MDPDKLKAAIQAIKDGDGDAALTILEAILTGDSMTPDPSSATSSAAPEAGDAPPKPADGSAPVATGKLDAASGAALMRLTGCKTEAEALTKYKTMQEDVARLSKTQDEIELNTRRGLIVELIKLGVETPALAWLGKDDAAREKRVPCKRLADEPLEELATRVATLKKSRPTQAYTPPEATDDDDVSAEVAKLGKKTLAAIKAKGMTPEEYIVAKGVAVRRIG
jgi:hypothetical protein